MLNAYTVNVLIKLLQLPTDMETAASETRVVDIHTDPTLLALRELI